MRITLNAHVLYCILLFCATFSMSQANGTEVLPGTRAGSNAGEGKDGSSGRRTTGEEMRIILNEYLAGTAAGMVGLIVGYPFDTIKVRLQNPDTARHYTSSMMHTFKTIVREERVFGLFKGITTPMVTLAPLNGLVFGCYGYFLRLQAPNMLQTPSLLSVMIAGSLTGVVSSLVTTPTELIKIRQQMRLSTDMMPSTREVVQSIYKAHGITGLYRGFTATVLRDSGYGPYFWAYEVTTRLCPPSPFTPLLAGAAAGILGWLATFPLDVIKTRIQSIDRDEGIEKGYRSTWRTAVVSYREEGWKVFWRGLRPTLVRAVPVNMATFGAFELSMQFLRAPQ